MHEPIGPTPSWHDPFPNAPLFPFSASARAHDGTVAPTRGDSVRTRASSASAAPQAPSAPPLPFPLPKSTASAYVHSPFASAAQPPPPRQSALEAAGRIAAAEADSVRDYTKLGFGPLNGHLRANTANGTAAAAWDVPGRIATLDAGVAKIAAEDTSLKKTFRGVAVHPQPIGRNGTYADAGYLSTSRGDTDEAKIALRQFTQDGDFFAVFGRSGADLARHGITAYPDEREVLYPRGTKFDVLLHADVSDAARARILKAAKNKPMDHRTARVTVLEERGMPQASYEALRKTLPEADLSPAIDPTCDRTRPAASLPTFRGAFSQGDAPRNVAATPLTA